MHASGVDGAAFGSLGFLREWVLKVAILAGGKGTRLAEETDIRPKPMVEVGSRPLLWHIMMHYSGYGFNEFVIALGYKGEYIKKYFADYCSLEGNLTVRLGQDGPGRILQHVSSHPNLVGGSYRDRDGNVDRRAREASQAIPEG